MDNKYKTILTLVFLIIIFILVSYLLKPKSEVTNNENLVNERGQIKEVKKTCEEICKIDNTDNCLYGCYSTPINIAIAEKDLKKCEEIKTEKIKKSCLDDVNLALHKCDKIISKELKEICTG